jgi:hypothetical protein
MSLFRKASHNFGRFLIVTTHIFTEAGVGTVYPFFLNSKLLIKSIASVQNSICSDFSDNGSFSERFDCLMPLKESNNLSTN